MTFLRATLVVVLLGLVVQYILSFRRGPAPPPNFGGYARPGFEAVERAFRKNFDDGFEPDGAAFALCHRGELVVDLWGGYADKMALRPWTEETMTVVFSATKGACALVIAMLVDRGLLRYDDLVIKHWPEFGEHGKANVTVKMLIGHEAGLAALDESITMDVVRDWRRMSKLFEEQVPNWPPGTDAGYHALTFGWLCDQLVRRIDPLRRSLGQFFNEEIAQPFGIDFYIGLPRYQLHRIARMTGSTLWDFVRRLDDWRNVQAFVSFVWNRKALLDKVLANPDWLRADNEAFTYNNPDILELEIGGANGVGTARAVAQLYCLLDGTSLLNRSTLDIISQPALLTESDRVMGMPSHWGWGLVHTTNPQGQYQLGHCGHGGQNAKFDPHERLAISYIRNNMAPFTGEVTRSFRALQDATYESVNALKSRA